MTFFPSRTSAFHDIIPAFTHLRKSLDAPVDSVVVNSSRREQCTASLPLLSPFDRPTPSCLSNFHTTTESFHSREGFPPLPPARRRARRRAPPPPLHIAPATSVASLRARGDRGDQLAAITVPQSIEYTQHIRTRASSYKQRRGQK